MRYLALFLALAPFLAVADWSFAWFTDTDCNDADRAGYIGMKADDYQDGGDLDGDIHSIKFTYDTSKGLGFVYDTGDDPDDSNVRLGIDTGDCFLLNSSVPTSWGYYPGA